MSKASKKFKGVVTFIRQVQVELFAEIEANNPADARRKLKEAVCENVEGVAITRVFKTPLQDHTILKTEIKSTSQENVQEEDLLEILHDLKD